VGVCSHSSLFIVIQSASSKAAAVKEKRDKAKAKTIYYSYTKEDES
jgi:hypothetical protein